MKIKSFRELEIWRKSKQIAVEIFRLTLKPQFKYDYGFKDQVRRASMSIPSNIAEGFERKSNNEFSRFLKIAKGSCGELLTQLEIASEVDLITPQELKYYNDSLTIISHQIGSLINYLVKKPVTRNS